MNNLHMRPEVLKRIRETVPRRMHRGDHRDVRPVP